MNDMQLKSKVMDGICSTTNIDNKLSFGDDWKVILDKNGSEERTFSIYVAVGEEISDYGWKLLGKFVHSVRDLVEVIGYGPKPNISMQVRPAVDVGE